MKRLTTILILTTLMASVINLQSQTEWEKYQENPILELGPSGSWDATSTDGATVLYDGSSYHMWYTGFDGTKFRIGHATSSDGISWLKDSNNPILDSGLSGNWDDEYVYEPCVIFNGSIFHLWYAGFDGDIEQIGHATSTDGINWTKDPQNPVLEVGMPWTWENAQVFPGRGSVIFDGTIYQMWYGGGNSEDGWDIGYATSMDGTNWTKYPDNPVMVQSTQGNWDVHSVIPGTVLFDGTLYEAWYSGCANISRWRVGYASSTDGITWVKDSINPVLDYGLAGSWDSEQVWSPAVLFDSIAQSYKMWYTGGPYEEGRIGYATDILGGLGEELLSDPLRRFVLINNYPNPFYRSATIEYKLKNSDYVHLTIYDQMGQLIYQTQEYQLQGDKQFIWNASEYPMGIYYFKIQVDSQIAYGKMVKSM